MSKESRAQRNDSIVDSLSASGAQVEAATHGLINQRGVNKAHSNEFYVPALDGVRTVAFALVLLSHTPGIAVVPGGLGVTIFFFLSGFLIATLMRREFDRSGTVSIRNFYFRRVLRIFPPMYLTLAIGAGLGFAGLLPTVPTWRGVAFEAAHLSNYFLILGNQQELVEGHRVFWSLAVEEHFYLFFPIIALWLFRALAMRRVAWLLAGAASIILAWRIAFFFCFGANELWLQHASDTRIDSILFGAIMAIAFNPVMDRPRLQKPRTAGLVLVGALAGLLLTAVPRSVLFRETIRYTLQGLLLIPIYYVLISRSRWPVIRWLNWRVVRYLGTITYSLYLVHDTILQTLHVVRPSWGWPMLAASTTVASIVYAAAVRLLVEKPLLVWRRRLRFES